MKPYLFSLLLLVGFPFGAGAQPESCANLAQQVDAAMKQEGDEALLRLLPVVRSRCQDDYYRYTHDRIAGRLLGRARAAFERGDFDAARRLLNVPGVDSWAIRRLQADIALREQRWVDAIRHLQHALELMSDQPDSAQRQQLASERRQLLDLIGNVAALQGELKLLLNPRSGDPARPMLGSFVLLFDYGSARLTENSLRNLQVLLPNVKKRMETDPNLRLTLKGYADSKGPRAYNRSLAARRAEAVAARLIRALPGLRVQTVAVGETRVAFNGDPDFRPLARRVEVCITRCPASESDDAVSVR